MASAAVKPAVPSTIASRSVSPSGMRHDPVGGHAHVAGVAAVVRDAQVVAGDEHPVARREIARSVLDATVPATSMPPMSGNRRRILPVPVAASASL